MDLIGHFTMQGLSILSSLFVFTIGCGVIAGIVMFIIDVTQTKDTVRRNFPVIGRFRYLFSMLGEFFRQYMFALDREEMPFNRAEREWVYHSASGGDNTVAFGSTRNLTVVGTPIFVNTPFPPLHGEYMEEPPIKIGAHARIPYNAPSFYNISAMSFGALSKPAVRALSHGAKHAGCWFNTGEGGLTPWHLEGGCDVVFQMGTAKYGVRDGDGNLSDARLETIAAHDQVRMFEIKLAQGAKPGKGGILPASKVTPEIAEIRGISQGQDSISPNRHPDVNSVTDLLDLIGHIREVTGKPTGFKTVVGDPAWLEDLAREIHQRGIESAPDFITIDSGDGGTGAAPMPLMDNMGMTVREALPLVSDILTRHGLKQRIRLIASGKLITPAEVAWAICAGADFAVSARGFMFAIGCIQAMKCNKNTCPTGVTTHDPHLQRGLVPEEKAPRVAHFVGKIRYGVGLIAHSCGVARPRLLSRAHVRIVQDTGRSVPLGELFPEPVTGEVPRSAA